jgi:hypothetical protein
VNPPLEILSCNPILDDLECDPLLPAGFCQVRLTDNEVVWLNRVGSAITWNRLGLTEPTRPRPARAPPSPQKITKRKKQKKKSRVISPVKPKQYPAYQARLYESKKIKRNEKYHEGIKKLREDITNDRLSWPDNILDDNKMDSEFQSCLKGDIEFDCMRKMHRKLDHSSLHKGPCAVCWEDTLTESLRWLKVDNPCTLSYFSTLSIHGKWSDKAVFEFNGAFTIFNNIPLLEKAFNRTTGSIPVCHTCDICLSDARLPPRSIANNLWIGPQSNTMRTLSVPAKILTSPIRQKIFIFK